MDYQAAIDAFVSVTMTDADTALQYLQSGDWDVERSVDLYLNSTTDADPNDYDVRAPIPAMEEQVLESSEIQWLDESYDDNHNNGKKNRKKVVDGGVTVTETVKTTVVSKNKKGKNIGAFRNFKDEAEMLSDKKSKRKIEKLNDIFRPPIDLLFNGEFEECKAVAAQANKLVIVNVQDKNEFASYVLNRDIWSDKRVASIIRLNFMLIQIDKESPEGNKIGRIYNVSKYPYVAIIDGITGVCMWSNSISKDGSLTVNDFLGTLQTFVDKNNEELASNYGTEETKKHKNISEYSEEEQLEIAIAESLKLQKGPTLYDEENYDDDDKMFSFGDGDDDYNNNDNDDNDSKDDIVENKNDENGNKHDSSDEAKNENEKVIHEDSNKNILETKNEIDEAVQTSAKRKAEDNGELCQYQFKIRDLSGKSTNAKFLSSDSVQDIRDYVDANIKPQGPYKIYLSYPKRLLDDNALISELHIPVRAVLVLQKS